jgi:hypothetical protein
MSNTKAQIAKELRKLAQDLHDGGLHAAGDEAASIADSVEQPAASPVSAPLPTNMHDLLGYLKDQGAAQITFNDPNGAKPPQTFSIDQALADSDSSDSAIPVQQSGGGWLAIIGSTAIPITAPTSKVQ